MHAQAVIPVWLIGSNRDTPLATYIATELPHADGCPDGIVLISSVVNDWRSRAVPEMALDRMRIPVLVTHHREDTCRVRGFSDVRVLMDRLTTPLPKALLVFDGSISAGDPCQARAYSGYNGIEREVVDRIAAWTISPSAPPPKAPEHD